MATAIQRIVTSFDDVLNKPYLDKFSATLNTVPVLGLKNNQIVSLATTPSATSKTTTKDVWTYFSGPLDGVTLDASSNVRFFPYHGHFCTSVGTAVWMKRHRSESGETLKQAHDVWLDLLTKASKKWPDSSDDIDKQVKAVA